MEELETYQLGEEVPFRDIIDSLLSDNQPIFELKCPSTGEAWTVYGSGRTSGFGEGDAPTFRVNRLALELIRIDAGFEITCRRKVYDPQAIERARQRVADSLAAQLPLKS